MASDQIQEIKDKVDIVELVNQYVPLKRAGVNHKGLCPFHREKSPSFTVNVERQIFKCFGCGEAGDVFAFIEKMEGLNFREALELLADRVGVKLERVRDQAAYQQHKDEKSALYRLNSAAAKFFHHLLLKHPSAEAARQYVASRKLTQESLERFQIGFAPRQNVLGPWLKKYGFTDADLKRAGNPERFFNRIMFPLRDALGNVVGFTGRSLEADQQPKYLNTPETPIFAKSKVIYGLFEGKEEIRRRKVAILVEGQMDVVLSHQIGLTVAVASSGTALTSDHLAALRRYTPKVLLAFDADDAGRAATVKALGLTIQADLVTKVISFPPGIKDVGEAIEQQPELWPKAVAEAQGSIDWFIGTTVDEIRGTASALDGSGKRQVAQRVLPILKALQDSVEQAHYVSRLAQVLDVPERALAEALQKSKSAVQDRPAVEAPAQSPQKVRRPFEEQLLGILALHPDIGASLTPSSSLFGSQGRVLDLFRSLEAWYSAPNRIPAAQFIVELRKTLNEADTTWLEILLLDTERWLGEMDPLPLAQELLARLQRHHNESIKHTIAHRIAEAEASGNRAQVKELMTELQALLRAH